MALENGIQAFFDIFKAAHPLNYQKSVLLGSRELAGQGKPPRTVVVPTTETFGDPVQWRDAAGNPRKSLRTRTPRLDIHLWGKDLSAVEELIHSTITVLNTLAGIQVTYLPSEWTDEAQASWLILGEAYTLSISLDLPVLKTETFAVIETYDTELAIETEI